MKKEITLNATSRFSRSQTRFMLLTALAALLLLAAARPTLWSTPAQAQKDDTCQFKLSDTVAGFNSDGGKGTLGIYTNSKSCEWEAVTKDDLALLARKLQQAGYSHGYEDAHQSNATTRQAKTDAASRQALTALLLAIERYGEEQRAEGMRDVGSDGRGLDCSFL